MSDEKPSEIDPEREGSKGALDVEKNGAIIPGVTEEAIRRGSVLPEQILKHSQDADIALQAFASHQGEVIHIDEATNKRLLWRIDRNLMPVCSNLDGCGIFEWR